MRTTKAVLKKVSLTVPLLLFTLCLPARAESNLYGGSGLFLTHSAEIMDVGVWKGGLYLHNYEYKLPVDPKDFDFVPTLGHSPWPKTEIMLSVPYQWHDDGHTTESGLADTFLGVKYLLHPMVAGLVYTNLGWGADDLGPASGSTDLGFMAVSSQDAGPVRVDLNAGYQFTDLGDGAGSDYLLWGVGVSMPLDERFKLFGEWTGAITTEGDSKSPSGWTAGMIYDINESIALTAGGGAGLVAQGTYSPDWRAFAGLTYTFGAPGDSAGRAPSLAPTAAPSPGPAPQAREAREADPELVKVKQRIELVMIRFPYDRNVVSPEGKEKLDEIVADLKKYPRIAIKISGHADSRGTASYNQILGERRAGAVRDYLVSRGIDAGRIGISSQGEMNPLAKNDSKGGMVQNRRATFSVGLP